MHVSYKESMYSGCVTSGDNINMHANVQCILSKIRDNEMFPSTFYEQFVVILALFCSLYIYEQHLVTACIVTFTY